MKKLFSLLTVLSFAGILSAQNIVADTTPELPPYAYSEIICNHLPTYRSYGVLFDFGQTTEAWAYNWLKDAEGRSLAFESGIKALNYMISRNWEFVQAFTSGSENQSTHYLLRIATSKLTDEQRTALLTPPTIKGTPQDKKKKKNRK